MNKLTIQRVDNRDTSTTWLWLNDTDYVEVDPLDLFDNAIENSLIGQGLEELKQLVKTRTIGWDDVRKWVTADYHDELDGVCGWEEAFHLYVHIQYHYFGIEDPADQ